MSKSTHFIGQPLLGQLLSFIDQSDVYRISKEHGGERYVKHFDGWHHLDNLSSINLICILT